MVPQVVRVAVSAVGWAGLGAPVFAGVVLVAGCGTAAASFAKIGTRIQALSEQVFEHAQRYRTSPRTAAFALAGARLDEIATRFPTT